MDDPSDDDVPAQPPPAGETGEENATPRRIFAGSPSRQSGRPLPARPEFVVPPPPSRSDDPMDALARFGAEIRMGLTDFSKANAEQEKHKSDNETKVQLAEINANKEVRKAEIDAEKVAVQQERGGDMEHRNGVIAVGSLSLVIVAVLAGFEKFAAVAVVVSLAVALVGALQRKRPATSSTKALPPSRGKDDDAPEP